MMDSNLNRTFFAACSIVLVLLGGCRLRPDIGSVGSLPSHEVLDSRPIGSVDVSGYVQRAGQIELAEGLTLRQAIARAGGVQMVKSTAGLVGATSTTLKNPLVRLQRHSRLLAEQDVFFALPLVLNGAAGSIPLRDGDWIEVVESSDVSIGRRDGTLPAGQRFALGGRVAKPGTYETTEAGTKLSQALAEAGQIGSTSVTLTRPKASGVGTESFVLPLNDIEFKSLIATSAVRDGDVIQLVELQANPLVLTALVEPILKKREATRRAASMSRERQIDLERVRPIFGATGNAARQRFANIFTDRLR